MDKSRLTTLIKNPHQIEADDLEALKKLRQEYPYFQALMPLMVIGDKKFNPQAEKNDLQSAAIHSLDRRHLKTLLGGVDGQETSAKDSKTVNVEQDISKQAEDPKISPLAVREEHLPDSFYNELFDEMESLKKSKEQYKRIVVKLEESLKEPKKKPLKKEAKKKTEKKIDRGTAKATAGKSPRPKAKPAKTVKTQTEPHSSIIDEIRSREKKTINDEYKKEQIALINNFIKNEPIITKKLVESDAETKKVIEDLSETSTSLSADIISETLAKLMIKQGHNDKAVDIYKKLIWKFPQKKSYFAEQIENLKKEQ